MNYIHVMCGLAILKTVIWDINLSQLSLSVISRQHLKFVNQWDLPVDMSFHLDATHDGNAPALMTGKDSLSEIVFGNVKIPSEHADHIAPFLQKLQRNFGNPQDCVHDMGNGICTAVAEFFPKTLYFVCHFHFLRDIGKGFLEPAYSSLRSCLRKHKISPRLHALAREIMQRISRQAANPELLARAFLDGGLPENTDLLTLASTYSITLWILQAKNREDGYGFPFDRPLLVFAKRLCEVQ